MADTGLHSPSLSSTGTWDTPNNAFSSDDVYTSSSVQNALQAWKNFTFQETFLEPELGIPSGATIDGIIVNVEGLAVTNGADVGVEMSWDNGTTYTTTGKFVSLTDPETIFTLGSSTDLWGRTWTDTDFSDTNFRVRLKNLQNPGLDSPSVDHVQVQVFYTEIATGTNMQINIGDVWKSVPAMQINIGDAWKSVASAKINIGDVWKTIF